MPKKIKIDCSKAAYERIIDAALGYYEKGVCLLGMNYYTCPAQKNKEIRCEECLRRYIVRVEEGGG